MRRSDIGNRGSAEMLTQSGSAEEVAGVTVGQPHEIPDLVAGHIEAGADEVIFSLSFADSTGLIALGEAFGLPPS
jgi:hypothetical protein